MIARLCILCILCICGMHSYVSTAFRFCATVYTVYMRYTVYGMHSRAKSKRPHMFTEVNIYALNYLSH